MFKALRRMMPVVVAALVLALTTTVASADGPGWTTVAEFPGPFFGVDAGKGDTLVVAGPEGPTKLDPDNGETELIAAIPGVSDVIQTSGNVYYVLTGEGERGPDDGPCPAMALCRVSNGDVTLVADIFEWELDNDPDESGNAPGEDSISNPFDLEKLGNKFLVADAGGNNIQVIDKEGNIELVAVLPYEDLPTQPVKDAVGCPNPPPDLAFICGLPATIPADPVATTATVGPGGDIYAGELKGFPAIPGTSRVWRIDRDARGVHCGTDDDECTQVDTPPLTSIVEMEFKGSTAYVLELDEASWLAAEGGGTPGGTLNACRASNGNDGGGDDDDGGGGNGSVAWTCEEVVTGLPFPTALAVQGDSIFVSLIHFFQGPFEVVELTDQNGDGEGDGDDDEDEDEERGNAGGNGNGDNEGGGNGNGNGGGRGRKDD